MKILVCVKVIKGEINPFDESALECALRLSDDVTVVSMGAANCTDALKAITRLGAKAVLISDCVFAGSDTLATSYILSQAIKSMEYDLILCGRKSVDGDTAQTGPMLSQRLNLPLAENALSVDGSGDLLNVKTRTGEEKVHLPALVTLERSYVLRFPSIFSKAGEVKVITHDDFKCDIKKCGLGGSPTRVLESFESERGRRKCKFISMNELFSVVDELMKKSTPQEDKTAEYTGEKLKSVWAVGVEVYEKAQQIADEVVRIDKSSGEEIAQRALREKPSVILWNADEWGRKNAAIAAVILETGLCADCTALETDGENLFMYRPAHGGSITAKIKCLTLPQTATVRTKSKSADIIVSGGRGVSDSMDNLHELAKRLNAQLGASRGLVDANGAPYDMQIGLSGKTVSPKIYIAVGISGAVHHTCAIEGSGSVIAINPDKNARIFDYADYGIIDKL